MRAMTDSVAGASFLVEQVLNEVSFERMVPADLRAEEAASAPHAIGARACGDRPEHCCQVLRPPKRGHVQASRRCQLVSVPYGNFDLAKDAVGAFGAGVVSPEASDQRTQLVVEAASPRGLAADRGTCQR
jgi:hypothetical protein